MKVCMRPMDVAAQVKDVTVIMATATAMEDVLVDAAVDVDKNLCLHLSLRRMPE